MSKMFSLAALLVLSSASYARAAAVSAPVVEKIYPEVVPGPGLPSLASIGLTSAQLYQSKDD